MLRNTVLLAALVLAPVFAAAQVPRVQYEFFDSPATHGKKFEAAFKQNDLIEGVNIDGRSFMLGGEWIVVSSWFDLAETSGSGEKYSVGNLVLGRVKEKVLFDTMHLSISLEGSKRSEYMKKMSSSCLKADDVLYSEVLRAEDKYQSCTRIRSFKYKTSSADPDRIERALRAYSQVNDLAFAKIDTKYYSSLMAETRYGAGIYIQRQINRDMTSLDDAIAFAKTIRSSISSGFFHD